VDTPLIGDLTITLADGTQLADATDLGLARQWAEHEHGSEAWRAMRFSDKNRAIAQALGALRAGVAEA